MKSNKIKHFRQFAKTLLLSSVLGLSSLSSYAQNEQNQNLTSMIKGLNENDNASSLRGKVFGASAQYMKYSDPLLKDLKLNEKILAQDINNFIEYTAKYFKQKPDFKGIFVSTFVIYPGYPKPYEFSKEYAKKYNQPEEKRLEINKHIATNSICNRDNFCSMFGFLSNTYHDEDLKDELDLKNFLDYLQKIPNNGLVHYPGVKTNLEPIMFTLIYGTNGKIVSLEEAEVLLENK